MVHALDVEKIGVPEDATPAFLGFNFLGHILGRAILTVTAEIPAELASAARCAATLDGSGHAEPAPPRLVELLGLEAVGPAALVVLLGEVARAVAGEEGLADAAA